MCIVPPQFPVLCSVVAALLPRPLLLPDDGSFHPVPSSIAQFLQSEFSAVPADYIVENISSSTCRLDLIPDESGMPFNGAYYCNVDFGCGEVTGVPVWFDAHSFWFGPDSAERLVAMYCADSISDPDRRKTLSEEVHQGG
jgi:hypothetical protein